VSTWVRVPDGPWLMVLSTISGYEVLVVALAVVALVVLGVSAILGVLTRLVRGVPDEPVPPRRRRWWRRSPGKG
jgi:hypothetical protein